MTERAGGPLATIAVRTVSPRTPRDGRVELGARAGRQLLDAGSLTLELDGTEAPASIGQFDCRCRDEEPAFYIESTLLASLRPGTDIRLEFDASSRRVFVRRDDGPSISSRVPGHANG